MASIRRTMSTIKREGGEQNEESTSDATPSPKLPHPQSYSAFGRLLSALVGYLVFLPFPGTFLQRSYRPLDRSKPKLHRWRKSFLHLSACFMVGVFVGFTPFLSVEISHKSVLKHQAFSFAVDSTAENVLPQVDAERAMFDTPVLPSNLSLDVAVAEVQTKEDSSTALLLSSMQAFEPVNGKQLIVVTPTYSRPFQAYSLNRLAQTLKSVHSPLLWIVIEMSQESSETAEILRKSGVMYRHLVCRKNITDVKDRVIEQRNVALSHIEQHQLEGIIYFADDDTIYSLELFGKMREIRHFGTWLVAAFSENKKFTILEGPVCNGSRVVGWHTSRRNSLSRRFHATISGFAFNSTMLWDSKTWHRPTRDLIRQLDAVKKHLQVSTFIEQLVEDESQMEGIPDDCSKIMAWHLGSEAVDPSYPSGWKMLTNMEPTTPVNLETAVRCKF